MYHITTEQIEAFLTLAQKKNYREVSEILFITQPTVTKYIQKLEKELGISLFQRSTQSVELTEEGVLLFDIWFPLYRRFLESAAEVQQIASARHNQLTVSMLRDYRSDVRPEDLTDGFEAYLAAKDLPSIPLSFRFLSMREQREALQNHHIDFSFSLGFDYDNLLSVQVQILSRKRIYALLPSRHRLSGRNEVSLKELENETFLVLSPTESFSANNVTATMLHKYYRHPRTRVMTNLQSMAYSLTQGEGITLGNRRFLSEPYEDSFAEVPVSELLNAGYEETMAYTTGDMNERKKLFLDFVQNKYIHKDAHGKE
ncbi:MAG: LysR family transcriptional regulator [bacterium]